MLYILWNQYQYSISLTTLYTKPIYTQSAYTILLSYIMVAIIGMQEVETILYYIIVFFIKN